MADLLKCHLIERSGEDYACWVEVADGLMVRALLPGEAVDKIKLSPDETFLWDAGKKEAVEIVPTPEEVEEWERIGKEIEELNREYHEDLKHRETGLEDEEDS